ncbi:MAG: hypothetical protein JSR27_10490 [Proteobacteria bacterium]|nr:hypothetical protein [Pseudomonadota bacterium]
MDILPCLARACAASCLLAMAPASAQVAFNVTFDGSASALTTTERANVTAHLQAAGRRWARLIAIDGARSIEVEVGVAAIATANGTSVTSTPIGTVGSRTIYEQGLAYELLSGIDPNGSAPDVHVNIGLAYLRNDLWFDPDPTQRSATIPANRIDAMSVFLHELGHALVYNGWSDLTTGQLPATYASTFDYWTTPGAPSVFSGPAATATWGVAPDLTTGNNKHWGNPSGRPLAPISAPSLPPVQWYDGAPAPVPVAAPPSGDAPPQNGAARPAASLLDQLMNGVVFHYQQRYDISALDIAVLRDTGITLDEIFANGLE